MDRLRWDRSVGTGGLKFGGERPVQVSMRDRDSFQLVPLDSFQLCVGHSFLISCPGPSDLADVETAISSLFHQLMGCLALPHPS